MFWRNVLPRRVSRNALLLALSTLGAARNSAADTTTPSGATGAPSSDAPPPNSEPNAPSLDELHAQGTEAYQAKDYIEAKRLFEEALALTLPEDAEARANLYFTLGSCSFELSDFREARARFVEAAHAHKSVSAEALVHAGYAAMKEGKLGDAASLLEASRQSANASQETLHLQKQLQQWLQEESAQTAEHPLTALWKEADRALAAGEYKHARTQFQDALKFRDLTPQHKAYFYRALGVIAAHLGNFEEEEQHLIAAFTLDPDPQDLVDRGYCHLSQFEKREADADLHLAVQLGIDAETQAQVEETRAALRPLAPRGIGAWIGLGGGFDTNAVQSGSAEALGVATLNAAPGSPFMSMDGTLAYTFRPALNWSISPTYSGSAMALVQDALTEQSLQQHAALLRVGYALDFDSSLHVGVGAATTLIGLKSVEPFSAEAFFQADYRRDFLADPGGSLRLDLGGRTGPVHGFGLYDYMSGWTVDVRAALGPVRKHWQGNGWASFRYYGIGQIDYETTVDQLFHCAERADGGVNGICLNMSRAGATYHVPLGFWAPTIGTNWRWMPSARWDFDARAQVEYRQYLADSFAETDATQPPDVVPLEVATKKRRHDLRPGAGAAGTFYIDAARHLSVGLRYNLQLSLSNMERQTSLAPAVNPGIQPGDPGPPPLPPEPVKNFDYDNRTFTQHVIELRMGVVF